MYLAQYLDLHPPQRGAPGEFETLTDDELLAVLRERLRALGLAPDAGSHTRH